MEEDGRGLELADHLVGVGDEVGRDVATVELHALDHGQLGLERLGLLDRDNAFLADGLHGLGDHRADLALAIGGDRADLLDLGAGRDAFGTFSKIGHHCVHRLVDAALQVHGVHAGGHRLGALAHDRLGQHRRRRGAVTGDVVGLGGDFAHHLRAHVLELVGKLDLLGDGHAVLGDARRAEGLVEHDVAPLGAEGDLDRVGQKIDAMDHPVAGVGPEFNVFGGHGPTGSLLEDSHHIGLAHDQKRLAVELDLRSRPLAIEDLIALLDVGLLQLAVLAAGPRSHGDYLALHRLFLCRIGNDDAAGGPLVLAQRLDDDTVMKRSEVHRLNPLF